MRVIRSRVESFRRGLSPTRNANRWAIVVNHRQMLFVILMYAMCAGAIEEMKRFDERRIGHNEEEGMRRRGGCLLIPSLLLDGSSIDGH